MWWLKYFLCIIFAKYYYFIAEEYYESENSYNEETENTTDLRRFGNDSKQEDNDHNSVVSEEHDSSQEKFELTDDKFKFFVVSDVSTKRRPLKSKTKIRQSPFHKRNWTTETTTNTYSRPISSTSPAPTNSIQIPEHLIKDYEYIYDDDITTNIALLKKPESLKELIPSIVTTERNENLTSVFLADFYNVQPAAIMPNMNVSYKSSARNTWYVPEKYPCWNLPLLYGELGKRKKTSNIFLIYGATLKNVVDIEGQKLSSFYEGVQIGNPSSHNKWCAVEPCYGDHTLCLFPDASKISKLCDPSYTVKTPIIADQIALVNTVNSMRNRIAFGGSKEYSHLPSAANMKQMIYDLDLEKISAAWLRQCLPGPAPCSALDGNLVTQLECTKYSENCCLNFHRSPTSSCIPKDECFVPAIIGCIYAWFLSAGHKLRKTDVTCGHTNAFTYSTAQILWAETNKMGCAFAERSNGDVRVVCNFAPGAPFFLTTQYLCGIIPHKDVTEKVVKKKQNVTNYQFLKSIGLNLVQVKNYKRKKSSDEIKRLNNRNMSNTNPSKTYWDLGSLSNVYKQARWRSKIHDYTNGTKGLIVRLVTKYTFHEDNEDRCDSTEPIYIAGEPGKHCVERGRRFNALCYDFGDPTPGYRFVAVIAPVALFSLILYDLFSGVVRQSNY